MPTYKITSNMQAGEDLLVKVYHGSGYTWSIGLVDKKKNEFILDAQESGTFVDHTDSITMVAAILGKETVWGTKLNERDPKKCDAAAWSLLTYNFVISGKPFRPAAPTTLFFEPK